MPRLTERTLSRGSRTLGTQAHLQSGAAMGWPRGPGDPGPLWSTRGEETEVGICGGSDTDARGTQASGVRDACDYEQTATFEFSSSFKKEKGRHRHRQDCVCKWATSAPFPPTSVSQPPPSALPLVSARGVSVPLRLGGSEAPLG